MPRCVDPLKTCSCDKTTIAMSATMDANIKRWTADRKTAVMVEIKQGRTTVAEVSQAYDLPPSEIEEWVDSRRMMMIPLATIMAAPRMVHTIGTSPQISQPSPVAHIRAV